MTPPRTGRPREFDPEFVLDAAMDAFWAHGYEGTSVADLLQATGLQKGSLYKAFGDKRRLYLAVLRRYLDRGADATRAVFDGDGPARETLAAWLELASTGCSRQGGRGCFGVNALVELGGQDPEVAKLVQSHMARQTRGVTAVVARGQKAGEFRDDVPAKELADLLGVFLSGLNAKARGPLSTARARRLIAGALSALDP